MPNRRRSSRTRRAHTENRSGNETSDRSLAAGQGTTLITIVLNHFGQYQLQCANFILEFCNWLYFGWWSRFILNRRRATIRDFFLLRLHKHAGCRSGSLQGSPELIPEEGSPPGFDIV